MWTATAGNSVWTNTNAGTLATLYSGNYITYYEQFRIPAVLTRMDVMKDAATRLLSALNGVNVGLMRYSRNGGDGDLLAQGGMVAYPVSPIDTNRQQLIDAVNSWNADGFTPLSETLFEAYRYFTGGAVGFGDTSVPFLSVAESRNPATADGDDYESPADFSCQKNYIVYLTDGLPTSDGQSNADIQALDNFATLGGACSAAGTGPDPDWRDSGLCLAALAGYMYNADLRGNVDSKQNVTSYWIGFGSDVAGGAALDYLNRTAQAGSGGQHNAFLANDAETLTTVLTGLALQILQTSTTFTAPTVAVNAFNRTRSLSDLYVSVFQPTGDRHWPGNLKKYSVRANADGTATVVGQNGSEAPVDGPGHQRHHRLLLRRRAKLLVCERGRTARARRRRRQRAAGTRCAQRVHLHRRQPGEPGFLDGGRERGGRREHRDHRRDAATRITHAQRPDSRQPDRMDSRSRRSRPVPGRPANRQRR